MAITKSPASVLSAVTSTGSSSAVDCSGNYAQELLVSITVVGTATTGASFIIQSSPDGGTTYYNSVSYVAGLSAGTYYWILQVPVTANKIIVAYTQQSGGTSSTITAQLGQVTAV